MKHSPIPVLNAAPPSRLAVGYVRVAACPQGSPRERLDAQMTMIRAVAAALGVKLVSVFEDAGESAHNAGRPGLLALLAAVMADQASVVIVPDLSRLARDPIDLCQLLAFLYGRGVRLVSVTGGV